MQSYDWLQSDTSHGAVILTASRRLSRETRRNFDQGRQAAGELAWASPAIFFLGDWIRLTLDECVNDQLPTRIDAHCSFALWEKSVKRYLQDELPGLGGVVRECCEAWSRTRAWRVPLAEIRRRAFTDEQRLFANAAVHYSAVLGRNNWSDEAMDPDLLLDEIECHRIVAPERIFLSGFDRKTPTLSKLLSVLENAGTTVHIVEQQDIGGKLSLHAFDDRDSELRAAGYWARELLTQNSQLRLAIITSDLIAHGAQIGRSVREGFAPGWQCGGLPHSGAVELSFGRPLAEYPSIAVALKILQWLDEGLTSPEVSLLLRSRHFGGTEISGRCRMEEELRRRPDQLWRPATLLAVLQGGDYGADAENWRKKIRSVLDIDLLVPRAQTHLDWAKNMDRLLDAAGWPGIEKPASNEFQLANRWRELLNEFAALDRVESQLSFADARKRLARMASDVVFQPESIYGRLPVMGALEAAGMHFDYLWISGFDASRWPAAGNALSYVSRQLQREYGMPDSTPLDTLAFSRTVLDRLTRSATEIVFSWAGSEDGVDQELSPLAHEFYYVSQDRFPDPGLAALHQIGSAALRQPAGDDIPPVSPSETIAGGAYTIQQQSRNPFAAFVSGRLGCQVLASFQTGLSPQIRGSLIHQALRNFYQELPSQADLVRMAPQDIAEKAARACTDALRPLTWHADSTLREIMSLELQRMIDLIHKFAEVEQERDAFQVVMVEQELELTAMNASFRMRADRVDRQDDGSLLVVDYKSGPEKPLLTRDGKLHNLQLAAYALALDKPIGGLMLINLDSRSVGVRRTDQDEGWPAQFAQWKDEALQVVAEFANGRATVNLLLPATETRDISLLSRSEELRRGR